MPAALQVWGERRANIINRIFRYPECIVTKDLGDRKKYRWHKIICFYFKEKARNRVIFITKIAFYYLVKRSELDLSAWSIPIDDFNVRPVALSKIL